MTPHSTQDHLPIAGIQDGVLLMTDGSLRVVLKIEPINFELKSENEQNSIIYSYQSFLNSLEFPVQIVIQSKRLDLELYLTKLKGTLAQQTNDLLRIQTEDYIGFVRQLISVANIMAKRFYVVVSHSHTSKSSSLNQLTSLIAHRPTGPLMEQDEFDRLRNEAYNKAGIIAGGLARVGAKCQALQTQDLIELFYTIYNPDVAAEERLTDMTNINAGVITSPEAEHLSGTPQVAPVDQPNSNAQPVPQAVPLKEEHTMTLMTDDPDLDAQTQAATPATATPVATVPETPAPAPTIPPTLPQA